MNYKDNDTVADLMQRLFLMTGIDTAHQRPTYHGRGLIGTMTLQELGFANEDTLQLMLNMRGGDPSPHPRIRGPLNSASAEGGAAFTLSISSSSGTSHCDQITDQAVAPVLGEEGQDRLLPPSIRRSDEGDCDEYPDDENYMTRRRLRRRFLRPRRLR